MFVINIHLVHGKSPRRDSILGSKWMNTIPPTSQVEWSFAPAWIHLFFFIRSFCHFRTSEAAGPGCATICPPHSKNTLPESAACDVEIQKCTAAFTLVTECLGAAERCQMSAHVLRVSRPAAFTFSFPVLLSVSAVCISWTATCLQAFWAGLTPMSVPQWGAGHWDPSGLPRSCSQHHPSFLLWPPASRLEGGIWTLSHRSPCESESATRV